MTQKARTVLLFLQLLSVISLNTGQEHHHCIKKSDSCSEESCERSIPCYHGSCDETGICRCEYCWEGEDCSRYVDNYPPVFPEPQQRVVVSDVWDADIIFTAKAYDADLGSTCPLETMFCECADVRYDIIDGNSEGLFMINNVTGEMYVMDPLRLMTGKTYKLLIEASGGPLWIEKGHAAARMELKVTVEDPHNHLAEVIEENEVSWLDIDSLHRSRRSLKEAADSPNYLTEFNFTLLGAEGPENMEMGKRLDYRLEIMIPRTDSMDLTLELFTKDVGNGNYTPVLALFNVDIDTEASGITFPEGKPHTEMLLNEEIKTAYDRAIITFGDFKNQNPNAVPIIIYFSVTQIRNPSTVYDSKYLVTAGAEYDRETYVWVGQSEVTVHNTTDEYDIVLNIIGSKEIPLDSAGVFVMECHIAIRSDNFTVEVNIDSKDQEVVSVGNLGVKDFDKNYDPVPQNIYFYNTTMEGSDDDVMFHSAQLYLGIMTNVGNYQGPKDDGNVINVTFAIYAFNNESNIDKTVPVEASVVVGREKRFQETFDVKLIKRVDADKMIEANDPKGEPITSSVQVGDMAIYILWFNMTNNGYADFYMEVEVPRDNKKLPRLEACSARMWKYNGSFDVPYVNTTFIDPEMEDEKYTFKFNRLHITGQRNPAIYNDSMIFIHLVVKVSALPANKEDKRLMPIIRVGTKGPGSQAKDSIQVTSLLITSKQNPNEPIMYIENAVDWGFLYLGGAVVLNITMEVPKSTGYADVMLETSGENNPPLPAVHICRAELSHVGRNVPCLRMHQDDVNANFTKYSMTDPKTRIKPDVASVILGDVGALPVEGKTNVTVSVVVELPEKSIIKDDESYPVTTGLHLTKNIIWAGIANYTMKKGPPPQIPEDKYPDCYTVYKDEGVVPGHLAEIEIFVRTKIQTISTYIIEVEGSTKDVSLCGLKVKSFGRNTPCIDMKTEPFYEPHDNPLDGNKVAGLKFSALSNIGFRENETHDTLSAIALVRISPSCKVKKTELQWRVKFGDQQKEGKIDITVILGSESSDMTLMAKEPKALAFKSAYPGKMVSIGTPVVVDLEVSLEPGSLAPVIVTMKAADNNKKKFPYDMCLGGIWFRGRNYPCFSPVQVESNFSSSDTDGKNDSATYNLGLVCNTFVDNKEEENKVTVRMALRPVDDGTLKVKDSFSIEGHATVGKHHKLINTIPFTIAREADQIEAEKNASVKLVEPSAIPIRIHQRLWIPFNITIPPDALLKVEAEAKAPLIDHRAIMTVHNMRLVSGGVNIPCPMLYPQPKVTFTPIVKTTQSDFIKGYFGYFTNLGLSHKMNLATEGDDDLTIEVEVEMSDHPENTHNSIFYLTFGAQVGRSNLTIDQPLKVFRDGQERADLAVQVKVDNTKVYQSGDSVDVTVTVKHRNESSAEPTNATIRLYLPPYMEFNKVIKQNVTTVGEVSFITEFGGLDIVLPHFLFSDFAMIVVSLLADQKNQRGFGRGEINATTPYRILCKQHYRIEPSPANPPTPDTIVNCGPVDYITYVVNSQECYKSLGIASAKRVYKCQLTASSAAKKETGPYNIRQGGKRGWSPALRLGPHKPYVQIDFLRTTRVSRIEFYKVENTRFVTKYRLQYSHTGSDWLYANSVTDLTYKKDNAVDTMEKPVQTRFVRVIVEEAEKGSEDSKYIGVKLEMYGCYIGEKSPSVTCSKHDPTWYSDDKNKYGRHFSVDTARDIAYFCDLEYDMENLLCFSSTDSGNSWRALPRSFGGFLGYDRKASRTYAFDKRKRAYVTSDDGILWTAVDETEVNTTMTKKSFIRSQPVPAFTGDDISILETKTGRWEATFDGLMYEGRADPKVKWSRCCKLTK